MSIPLDPVSLTEFVSLVYHDTPGQNTSMQRIAYEKQAYTLTDRRKWFATKDKDRLEMIIVLVRVAFFNNKQDITLICSTSATFF